ncbi:MAG: carbohydrate ABC transporter substrate-binding protein, partial [Rhodoglobus sp.]
MKTTRFLSASAVVATIAMAGLALSGCSGGTTTGGGTQTDSGGKITVWVDPPRVPAADAFKAAHPEIPIDIVQIDGTVGGKTVQQ